MPPNETRRRFFCEVVYLDSYPHSRTIAVDSFYRSSFGAFLERHFADLFTKASQQSFLLLALGFVLSTSRHTVANYLWRAGACAFKHFTVVDLTNPTDNYAATHIAYPLTTDDRDR